MLCQHNDEVISDVRSLVNGVVLAV